MVSLQTMKFDMNKTKNHDDVKTMVCIVKTMKHMLNSLPVEYEDKGTMQHLLDRLVMKLEEFIEVENGRDNTTSNSNRQNGCGTTL